MFCVLRLGVLVGEVRGRMVCLCGFECRHQSLEFADGCYQVCEYPLPALLLVMTVLEGLVGALGVLVKWSSVLGDWCVGMYR